MLFIATWTDHSHAAGKAQVRMLLITILLVVACLAAACWRLYTLRSFASLPGPRGLWVANFFVGAAPLMMSNMLTLHLLFRRMRDAHGGNWTFDQPFGLPAALVVANPSDCKRVLENRKCPRDPHGGLGCLAPRSTIALGSGREHDLHRRMVVPLLQSGRVRAYFGAMERASRELAERWAAAAAATAGRPSAESNVYEDTLAMTLEVIMEVFFGAAPSELPSALRHGNAAALEEVLLEEVRRRTAMPTVSGLIRPNANFGKCIGALDEVVRRVVSPAPAGREDEGEGRDAVKARPRHDYRVTALQSYGYRAHSHHCCSLFAAVHRLTRLGGYMAVTWPFHSPTRLLRHDRL